MASLPADDLAPIAWPIPLSRGGEAAAASVWMLSPASGALSVQAADGAYGPEEILEFLAPRKDPEGRLWPSAFAFNPWTGASLAPALTPLEPTLGPNGGLNGLPMTPVEARLDPKSRALVDVPPGDLSFAQGGDPGFLFAIDLKAGRLHRKTRSGARWIDLGDCPATSLPAWSGVLLGEADGVYYASDAGLVRIGAAPRGAKVEVFNLGGRLLAAPAGLSLGLAAPVQTTSQSLIAWQAPDGEVRTLTLPQGARLDGALAAPVIGAPETAYWIGAHGYVWLDCSGAAPRAGWTAWPEGFEAAPFLRPFEDPNSGLWALGAQDDNARPAACPLIVGPAASPAVGLGRPMASAGLGAFGGRERVERPGEGPVESVPVGLSLSDRWLAPIVRLSRSETIVVMAADGDAMTFLYRRGEASPHEVEFYLHRANAGLVPLGQSADLITLEEIETFVADGRLHLYHRAFGECATWALL